MFSSFEEECETAERPWARGVPKPALAWPEPLALERVLSRVAASKRPILIGGHGVWWSRTEDGLERTGRELGIPVFNVPYHQKLLGEENDTYMGLADIHQYAPSKTALQEADLVLMVGGRLDNQMNFGNPPLFPESTSLICINGSHEELEQKPRSGRLAVKPSWCFFRRNACHEGER